MLASSLRALVWTLAIAAISVFVAITTTRLTYPLELDYIEGAVMDHVVRLANGQPIYVEPSLEFVPLAYMPLFPALASLLARVFGPALWEPRLVLLLSALGIAALTFGIVRKETGRWTFAAAAAGIYLGGLGIAGGHYDVARPDSLMLFLSLGGLAVLRFTTTARGAVLAGLLLTLGFFTKQHAVWFALAGLLHVVWNDRARLWPFAAALLLGCGGGYLLLSAWLGPWFSFYTWDVPSHWSHVSEGRLQRYLGERLVGQTGPLLLAVLAAAFVVDRPWRGRSGVWCAMGLGGLATGLMATLDPGAFKHTFLGTLLALAVLGPVLLQRLAARAAERELLPAPRAQALACVVLALQFLPLVYEPGTQLPRAGAVQAHEAFVSRLAAIPGQVLVLRHGFWTWQAGKGMGFHHLPLSDIERAHGNRLERTDPDYLARLFEPLRSGEHRPTLVTDLPLEHEGSLYAQLAPFYRLAGRLDEPLSATLLPVTGAQTTPVYIYAPRDVGVADASAPRPESEDR